MRCPFCGNVDTQVKDSRPAEDHVAIRRRRFCSACGGRFTTYERVQLRDLVVVKTNGRREDFDRDKLERSIRIAAQKRPIEPERLDQLKKTTMGITTKSINPIFINSDCCCENSSSGVYSPSQSTSCPM